MARVFESPTPELFVFETVEHMKACAHIRGVFGRSPTSIRPLSCGSSVHEVMIVKLRGSLGVTFEFFCVDGLLFGIPPKRSGQR
jgi:hypothetical protein